MSEVEVLQPGLFSTIQDGGRIGYLEYGVPLSGPMDSYSAGLANLILNNQKDCAVLEITQTGPKLRFQDDTVIVVTGAQLSPTINSQAILNNVPYKVKVGDMVSFGKRIAGCRAYLAVAGGFQTEIVLGSRSWYDGITPLSSLQKGGRLFFKTLKFQFSGNTAIVKMDQDHLNSIEIPVFPGPEFSLLPQALQKELFDRKFAIDKNNNRMGVQLQEDFSNSIPSMITGPVLPGTVQLTPSGKLIVLMRDCQTTGGYARVLQLAEQGLNRISQKVTGDKIIFFKAGKL